MSRVSLRRTPRKLWGSADGKAAPTSGSWEDVDGELEKDATADETIVEVSALLLVDDIRGFFVPSTAELEGGLTDL